MGGLFPISELSKCMDQYDVIRSHLIEQKASDEVLKEFDFAQRLVELTEFYRCEAIRCFEAQALFAASILTASALESLLMQFCLSDKARVAEFTSWKALPKSQDKPFLETLQSKPVTLGFLLNLAKDMAWFPVGPISDEFKTKVIENFGEENRPEVLAFADEFSSADELFELMADLGKDGRNLLHPAVCIREKRALDDRAGKETFVFLITLLVFLELKVDQMLEEVVLERGQSSAAPQIP